MTSRDSKAALAFLAPALILLGLFRLWPAARSLAESLRGWSSVGGKSLCRPRQLQIPVSRRPGILELCPGYAQVCLDCQPHYSSSVTGPGFLAARNGATVVHSPDPLLPPVRNLPVCSSGRVGAYPRSLLRSGKQHTQRTWLARAAIPLLPRSGTRMPDTHRCMAERRLLDDVLSRRNGVDSQRGV